MKARTKKSVKQIRKALGNNFFIAKDDKETKNFVSDFVLRQFVKLQRELKTLN